jgi:hypothetical protein
VDRHDDRVRPVSEREVQVRAVAAVRAIAVTLGAAEEVE